MSTHRLTEVQYDTIAWLVACEAATGAVPTKADAAAHFGIKPCGVDWRWTALAKAGLIALDGRGGTTILPAACALVSAGKEAATTQRCTVCVDEPPADATLPARIGVTASGLRLLRLILSENRAGREPRPTDLSQLARKSSSAVVTQLKTLRLRHLVEPDAVRVTSLGVAVTVGRVSTERPQKSVQIQRRAAAPPTAAAPQRLAVTKAPPPAPRSSVASCRAPGPSLRVAPIRREVGSAPLPLPALPALPARIATFRGVRHPPLPQAHGAPPGMREDTWAAITTVRSPFAARES